MMIFKRLFNFLRLQTYGRVLRLRFGPKSIMDLNDLQEIELIKPIKSGRIYFVASVPDAILFTDTIHTISISKDHKMIPEVSWQYEQGRQKDDSSNYYLNGKIFPQNPPEPLKGTVISLLTGGSGINNYYHWLFDVLPRLKLIQDTFSIDSNVTYLLPDNSRPYQKETLSLLEIPTDKQLTSLESNHIKCERCIATSYPSYNDIHRDVPKWIIEHLRNVFLPFSQPTELNPFIYISRSDSHKKRFLIGEEQLSDELAKRGFRIVELSNLKVIDQISLFSQAEMIVGVHGAGFANLTFCKKGCKVLELFSPDYKPKLYELISNHLDLNYNKMILDKKRSAKSKQHSHVVLTRSKMKEILEKIDAYL